MATYKASLQSVGACCHRQKGHPSQPPLRNGLQVAVWLLKAPIRPLGGVSEEQVKETAGAMQQRPDGKAHTTELRPVPIGGTDLRRAAGAEPTAEGAPSVWGLEALPLLAHAGPAVIPRRGWGGEGGYNTHFNRRPGAEVLEPGSRQRTPRSRTSPGSGTRTQVPKRPEPSNNTQHGDEIRSGF